MLSKSGANPDWDGCFAIFVKWSSVRLSVRPELVPEVGRVRAAFVLACHPHATLEGHARSLGDNHGHVAGPTSWSYSFFQLECIPWICLIRPPWPVAATRDENRVGPFPSSRPSATTPSSNPSPHDPGISFRMRS